MEQSSIFISYSHKDKKQKDLIMSFLHVLERTGIIDQWSDDSIGGGDKWREEIDKAMKKADLAIFLITTNFLNSKFIMDVEVPTLLKRKEEDGIIIFPVIAKHCLWNTQDWLNDLQVRPKNGEPVWPTENIDKKLTKLAREIDTALRKSASSPLQYQPSLQKKYKGHLVDYKINMKQILSCFFDDKYRLWVYDTNEVNIFQINIPDPIEKILLPKLKYKKFLQTLWDDSLICSDWDGALYQFGSKNFADGRIIRKPKFNDLPIHYLTVGEEDQLIAGTWDGKILSWHKKEGKLQLNDHPINFPYLPTQILPLPDGSICVVDQKNYLRSFHPDGVEAWVWQSGDAIMDIWFQNKRGTDLTEFFLLLESNEIIKILHGAKSLQSSEKLSGKVLSISHSLEPDVKRCSVLALEGGAITWLSWSPFRILHNYQVDVDFEVKSIRNVYDPQRPNAFIALALSRKGELFSINSKEVTHHPFERAYSFVLDNYGRYIAMIHKAHMTLISNPAIKPATCAAEVVESSGILIVGMYKEMTVTLQNTGKIPINKIRASLQGDDCIQTAKIEYDQSILPSASIVLSFQVKALVAGDALPLELHLDLEDDFGQTVHAVNSKLVIQSKER